MHRSCLAGFIIDCHTDDLSGAATFWSGALGLPPRPGQLASNDGRYITFESPDLHIEVQRVDHESRVHLDIESDVPTGQRFCVVRAQTVNFAQRAGTWD